MVFIINAGGWYVGNTAVLEWLAKFPNICYIPGDLDVLREKDGIFDLIQNFEETGDIENSVRKIKKLLIIKVTKVLKYRIANYSKYLFTDFKYTFSTHERKLSFYLRLWSAVKKMQRERGDLYSFWREWVISEAKILNGKKQCEFVLLQNPFYYKEFAPEHDGIWQKIFNNRKIIFVCRNHKDQFKNIKDAGQLIHTKNTRFRDGTRKLSEVERFYTLNKKLYLSRIRFSKNSGDALCVINFEDFVNERCNEGLKQFIGLETEYDPIFNFGYSQGNVGIYLKDKNLDDIFKENKDKFENLDNLKKDLLDISYTIP